MSFSAVIGANYGDEGKGRITDYLCSRDPHGTLVVRFNGGAQAGHTVVTPDGKRHVFHHFGSGTLVGSPTFFSKHFLVNPALFVPELKKILDLGEPAFTYVDPDARVTTPWDMLLNQALENRRAGARHGSCGIGINETVVRSEVLSLRVSDLYNFDWLKERLYGIQDVYVPDRMHELGLANDDLKNRQDPDLIHHFLEDCAAFRKTTRLVSWSRSFVEPWRHIVFEGAQGLRLDEEAAGFPHVTRSRTGLTNVAEMVVESEIGNTVATYYVTRPYMTRHGAGPLSHEISFDTMKEEFPAFKDETNVPNAWQGTLRYGFFDVEEFVDPILSDIKKAEQSGIRVERHLAFTCLDHLAERRVRRFDKGDVVDSQSGSLWHRVCHAVGAPMLTSILCNGEDRLHTEDPRR